MRFILFDFKKQTLQVFSFGMIDADGVVHGMGQTPHYTHLLTITSLEGSFEDFPVISSRTEHPVMENNTAPAIIAHVVFFTGIFIIFTSLFRSDLIDRTSRIIAQHTLHIKDKL